MRIFDAEATRAALPFERLVQALRATFAAGCEVPQRHVHEIAGADGSVLTSLIMPAWTARYYGIKTVNVAPGNAARGLAGEPGDMGLGAREIELVCAPRASPGFDELCATLTKLRDPELDAAARKKVARQMIGAMMGGP